MPQEHEARPVDGPPETALNCEAFVPRRRKQLRVSRSEPLPFMVGSLSDLFQRFNGPICTYLARIVGNDEAGRDLAQETFLRAWKSLPTLQGELHFKAWLYRIATNVAQSHLRHSHLVHWLPWVENEEGSLSRHLRVPGPEEQVGEVEMIKHVLARLSPQYQSCLLLQVMEGFSQKEIAAMLGISEKSVGSNVSRGREQFRHIYQFMKGNAQ